MNSITGFLKALEAENRRLKQKRDYEEHVRMERLKAATTFTITISRMKNSVTEAVGLEKFHVEGYANAKIIFDAYRQDGHLLKLKRLRMRVGEEIVHSVIFKYQ